MTDMLKRLLPLALLITLTVFCASPVGIAEDIVAPVPGDLADAACNACPHDEYELIGDPSKVPPSILRHDAVYHKSAKVLFSICLDRSCANKITVYVNTRYIQHTFTANGDDHRDGTSVHRYFQICSACGEETWFDMYCLDCE